MDLSAINPVLLIASLMVAATPLLFAAIGELVVERAGVLNLGIEGMMILGAIAGFSVTLDSGSYLAGIIAAAAAGAVAAFLFGVSRLFSNIMIGIPTIVAAVCLIRADSILQTFGMMV